MAKVNATLIVGMDATLPPRDDTVDFREQLLAALKLGGFNVYDIVETSHDRMTVTATIEIENPIIVDE